MVGAVEVGPRREHGARERLAGGGVAGVAEGLREDCLGVEADRRAAIALAASLAKPGDVLLVAGKGHEVFQQIGSERLPFDDHAEVAKALSGRSAT